MSDLEKYNEKKVVLTIGGEKTEGKVMAASAIGIVFKAKGSSATKLIEAKDIEDIAEVVAGPKKLKSRVIPQVHDAKNREHLIERHGYKVSEIEKLSEEDAKAFHDSLDHSDLGHSHRPLTEAELAIREAQAAADDDED